MQKIRMWSSGRVATAIGLAAAVVAFSAPRKW